MKNLIIYTTTCFEGYMMMEQGTGFTLEPWTGNTKYYKGESDDGVAYVLPDGYEVAETKMGNMAIFNDKGEHCSLISDNGVPTLVFVDGVLALKEVA